MFRTSRQSLARIGLSLGIVFCLFAYGGVAFASPHAPRATPLYVTCSVKITKTLAQNATSDGNYAVHAYVFGEYDSRQTTYYCGPMYGEAEVVDINQTNPSQPAGTLKAVLYDVNSFASTTASATTTSFGTYGDAYAVDTNGETWTCAHTTASFSNSKSNQSIDSGNGCA